MAKSRGKSRARSAGSGGAGAQARRRTGTATPAAASEAVTPEATADAAAGAGDLGPTGGDGAAAEAAAGGAAAGEVVAGQAASGEVVDGEGADGESADGEAVDAAAAGAGAAREGADSEAADREQADVVAGAGEAPAEEAEVAAGTVTTDEPAAEKAEVTAEAVAADAGVAEETGAVAEEKAEGQSPPAEPEPEAKPEVATESEIAAEAAVVAEPAVAVEPEIAAEPTEAVEVKSEAATKTGTGTKVGTKVGTGSEAGSDVEAQAAVADGSAAEPEAGAEPVEIVVPEQATAAVVAVAAVAATPAAPPVAVTSADAVTSEGLDSPDGAASPDGTASPEGTVALAGAAEKEALAPGQAAGEKTGEKTAAPAGRGRRVPAWAVLAVCCFAQFMVVLDVSIVNVALPSMQTELDLSSSGLQWVVNAYTLAFAGLLLFGGRAADLFGRRRVFISGLVLFTAASLAGGLAENQVMLIVARAVQGLGGAVLAPATLSILMTSFPDPRERARALGMWGATAAGGGAMGALAGGVLTEIADWRWVLFVNVPIGLVLLVGARAALVESRGQARGVRDLDIPGTVTVTAGLTALVYGIVRTESSSWGSPVTIGWLVAAAVLLTAFLIIESRTENPLVPLGIFRRKALRYANTIGVVMGSIMFGLFFFLTLYLQQVKGQGPLEAGLALVPMPIMIIVGSQVSSRTVGRFGPRPLIIGASVIVASSVCWLSALSAHGSYWSEVFGPLTLLGFGMGINMVSVTTAATAGVPPQLAGLASGLLNTARQIGAAVGLAVLAIVADTHTDSELAAGADRADALTSGYSLGFLVCAALMFGAAALAVFMPRKESLIVPAGAAQARPEPERVEALAEA
ncbi:DHA2 family efflux MFS transporter permease subunit [Frankia sp. Mgl5]|uniref:MFS transporter n=1 Tax=Frankia sp. Mgl5 TaxID=2933793 RepID=UPI00200F856A|nr:MFS transporter [Frankia sp. Mgl5]MCK9931860.1 DHA2 family efflux MFS transporter permease subunit [Frankia sp. Mgl5]